MTVRAIRGMLGIWGCSAAFALCLSPLSVPAAPPVNAHSETASPCDSSKNRDTWYFDYRECGSRPTQIALLANVSTEEVRGSQYSFMVNVAAQDVEGVQLSGAINVARRVHTQLLSDVNIARRVDFLQLGGLNIADTVAGTQIGFLNIADRLDGWSVGFLTFAGNGLLHADATTDETGMGKMTFASGKGLFTSYSFGYTPGYSNHPFSFGMGFGYHRDFGRMYAEAEMHANLVLDRNTQGEDFWDEDRMPGDSGWRHNPLFQGKLRLGGRLIGALGVFGGVSYNALVHNGNEMLTQPWSDDFTNVTGDANWWPGVEFGIRLGR